MNGVLPALAAISGNGTPSLWSKLSESAREHVTLFGTIAGVVAFLLLWALFIRERRREQPRYHYPHPPSPGQAQSGEGTRSHRRKWRRRRRGHRPRNPTLAETGGLPPIRSEDPPSSSV
jgi:hypothetical protein